MDFSLIAAAVSSIKAAKDIGAAALAARDDSLVSAEVAKMNGLLLDAQQALFDHNTQLLTLQQQLLETAEQLRKAQEALAQRGAYTLVETADGQWAYRVNTAPVLGGPVDPAAPQRLHYVCQPCFDNGRKVVLQFGSAFGPALQCPVCLHHVGAAFLAGGRPRGGGV